MLNFSDLLLGCEDTQHYEMLYLNNNPKVNVLLHVHGSVTLLTVTWSTK
jgi:hypothetical protein